MLATVAHADKRAGLIEDAAGYQVRIPSGWTRGPTPVSDKILAQFTNRRSGKLLVISRTVDVAQIEPESFEAIVRHGATEFHRISIERWSVGGHTAFDLWFSMIVRGKTIVGGSRLLVFDGYGLLASIECPGQSVDASTRALLDTFRPSR